MREYTEKPLSEINVGSMIVKQNGFVYQLREMHEISKNVRCIVLEDSYGNFITEYSNINKPFYVREDNLQEKSGAWQRKEGKNPKGGLNEKGRKSYERENPGSDLKPPVKRAQAAKSKKSAARRKSFCARMGGMPGPMKDEKGRPTRKALSLRAWDCGSLSDCYEPSGNIISEFINFKKKKEEEEGNNPTKKQLERIARGEHWGGEISANEMGISSNAADILRKLRKESHSPAEEKSIKKIARDLRKKANTLNKIDEEKEEHESVIKRLAKMHGVSEEKIEEQLEMGMEVEKEHTSDEKKAMKIAIDHLEEKPDYYTKLKKYVEGDMKEEKDNEHSMGRAQISTIMSAGERLKKKLKGEGNLPAWVQAKLTKASDYIDSAADYMDSGEGKVTEGKIYDRLVQQLRDKGTPLDRAHAIATSQLQKSGVLKKGTKKLTKKGKKRQAMGAAGRAKDRAAKRSGRKTSDYKYDPKSNIATLKNSYEPQGNMLEEGENKPTNPEAWADCISQAKSKFKVYPSAYANGWASKCYKKKGGGWKKAK